MREYPRRRASPCLTQHRVRRLSNRPPDQGIPGDHRPRSTQHPADPRDLAAWRCHFPKSSPLGFRASFEVSFASLPGRDNPDGVDPAQAFRLLGLWQGPSIGLPAAAALLGQPESAVADALEVLVDAHLLDSPEPDAYRFHDLLRVYAADLARAQETAQVRQDAVTRVLAWYLHTVEAAAGSSPRSTPGWRSIRPRLSCGRLTSPSSMKP
jgi:hypothetical protein